MNHPCSLFENWLDRLPRRELSPAFETHLSQCAACRARMERLKPVTDALSEKTSPETLSTEFLATLGEHMRSEFQKRQSRRLGLRLFWVGFLCLPLIAAVNFFWGTVLFSLISTIVSPLLARVILGMFIAGTVGISGLVYCSLPILASWKLSDHASETSL